MRDMADEEVSVDGVPEEVVVGLDIQTQAAMLRDVPIKGWGARRQTSNHVLSGGNFLSLLHDFGHGLIDVELGLHLPDNVQLVPPEHLELGQAGVEVVAAEVGGDGNEEEEEEDCGEDSSRCRLR